MHQSFAATVEFKGIKNAKDSVNQFMISIMVREIVKMVQMKESQVKHPYLFIYFEVEF